MRASIKKKDAFYILLYLLKFRNPSTTIPRRPEKGKRENIKKGERTDTSFIYLYYLYFILSFVPTYDQNDSARTWKRKKKIKVGYDLLTKRPGLQKSQDIYLSITLKACDWLRANYRLSRVVCPVENLRVRQKCDQGSACPEWMCECMRKVH